MISKSIFYRTKNDIRILDYMLGKGKVTASEIAKELKTSKSRIRVHLKGLNRDGLIKKFEHPKQHFYELNIGYEIMKFAGIRYYERFMELNRKRNNLPFLIGSFFSYKLNNLESIILFGSYLKEEKANDIDVAVVLKEVTKETLNKINDAKEQIRIATNKEISTEVYTYEEFIGKVKTEDHVVSNILEGLPLISMFSKSIFEPIENFLLFKFYKQYYLEKERIKTILSKLLHYWKTKEREELEEAKMDCAYLLLHRSNRHAENDYEAKKLLKKYMPKEYSKLWEKEDIIKIVSELISKYG